MRPTVRSDGRDPEQLGGFERPASLVPVGRGRGRVAEARVESVTGCVIEAPVDSGAADPR